MERGAGVWVRFGAWDFERGTIERVLANGNLLVRFSFRSFLSYLAGSTLLMEVPAYDVSEGGFG